MVLQYQNELLVLAATFIILLVYMYIKRKTVPTNEPFDKMPQEKQNTSTPTSTEPEEPQEKTLQQTVTSTAKKQTTPKHGKISKEDFKIFSGKKILVAEDNIINQKVILGVLGESGMNIVFANDGQEALDILQDDYDFMLIFMDAHMPKVDGYEATKIIRKNPEYNHIPIVALSGDTASNDIKKMKYVGMEEHLEKPLKVDALYDILYQYSNEISIQQEKTSSDMLVLDIQKGLQICGNDVGFYHDILKEFLSTYSNSSQELKILLKNGKKAQADQLLLDIVGVSANIGAGTFATCANMIKNNITSNKDINLDIYTKRLQELIQSINNYFLTYN